MMPVASPAVPVCTPAERSKWPPIISNATGNAIRPTVDAPSSQFAAPSVDRNTFDSKEKNTKMTMAPTSAPNSGLTSSRRSAPTFATRSSGGVSSRGVRSCAAVVVAVIGCLPRPA